MPDASTSNYVYSTVVELKNETNPYNIELLLFATNAGTLASVFLKTNNFPRMW